MRSIVAVLVAVLIIKGRALGQLPSAPPTEASPSVIVSETKQPRHRRACASFRCPRAGSLTRGIRLAPSAVRR